MPGRGLLLPHRQMRLMVGQVHMLAASRPMRFAAPFLQLRFKKFGFVRADPKILAQAQIPLIARYFVQFDQRQLDFLVPVVARQLPRLVSEHGADIIRKLADDVEQLSFARSPVIRHPASIICPAQ